MKIGILQTAYKKSADYGAFYNVQELGLARALATSGHEVKLYKAVDGEEKVSCECQGLLTINLFQVSYIGINAIYNPKILDKSLDVLIYFSDTQIKVPAVYKWCITNGVKFIPYVGVVESHSEKSIKRFVMDRLSKRNLEVYRKCKVLAKTPAMVEKLKQMDCTDTVLFPVGLDESVMAPVESVGKSSSDTLNSSNKIHKLLFIGRMEEEKQPLEMISLFDRLLDINDQISLVMIGDGYLYEEVEIRLQHVLDKHQIDQSQVQLIRKVPYKDIHRYYKEADLYVNLNKVEILGMSILESMYYYCPVLAISAPGPEFILKLDEHEDNQEYCGMIAPDMESLFEVLRLFEKGDIVDDELSRIANLASQRVREDFLWKSLTDRLIDIIKK